MKEKKKKQPLVYKTSFMVYFYMIIMIIAMITQFFMAIVYESEPHIDLPISAFSYFWIVICAAYIGVDRCFFSIKSTKDITADIGDPSKLRRLIFLSGLVLLMSVFFSFITGANFEVGSFATAFGTNVALYVSGQKVVQVCGEINIGNKEKQETKTEKKPETKEDIA